MGPPQIIIPRCFYKELNCTILAKAIHNLSEFMFDVEGEPTFLKNLFQAVPLCLSNIIHYKHVMARLITLTFKGCVNKWFHTLPISYIHPFDQLAKAFNKAFDKYDY